MKLVPKKAKSGSIVHSVTFMTLLLAALLPSWVSAHQGATGVVKERMDAMKEMSDQMKIMGDMLKGKRPFEIQAFVDGSTIISKHSPEIPGLFPKGSGGHESEALPKLWHEWDRFEMKAKRAATEASKLADLSLNGEDQMVLRKQFMALGKSCKSCHKDYREKKEK